MDTTHQLKMTPLYSINIKSGSEILESIEEGVFTVNLDWQVSYFNRAAEKIIRIPRREAIGRFCWEVFRTDICKRGCSMRQVLASGKPIANRSVYFLNADRKRIPISVNAAPLRNARGKVIGGVEIFRDLTAISELRRSLLKQQSFDDIISKNGKMGDIFTLLPQVAASKSTVLIQGASGTGKELLARAIHNHSPLNNGPFVAVNCGALPENLVESELFGYKAGAFTDAKFDRPGRFAQARNGTLLLDEIGEMPPVLQVKLLRVLEQRTYEPLGCSQSETTNARIIATTNQDLENLVAEGKFRRDLFYRINIMRFTLPPLSERLEDIPLLVDHFIERYNRISGRTVSGISHEAIAAMMLYEWPGNVRELENVIERAFIVCRQDLIDLNCLPMNLRPSSNTPLPVRAGYTLRQMEKLAIENALLRNNWKRMKTARELGIDKNTLRLKIKRLGIEMPN